MLAYRVFPYLPTAAAGSPGHPAYLPESRGLGRLDNPDHYRVWYLSLEQSGAVGEAFGDLRHWREEMFGFPELPGTRRALATYELPDEVAVLDLDDARSLLDRGLRPTQVVERNRAVTQAWALAIFREAAPGGGPRWVGVRWWSYHRPGWRILGVWGSAPDCVRLEELNLDHPAVVDAARALAKPLPPPS